MKMQWAPYVKAISIAAFSGLLFFLFQNFTVVTPQAASAAKVSKNAGSSKVTAVEDDDVTLALPAAVLKTLATNATFKWAFVDDGKTSALSAKTSKATLKEISLASDGNYRITAEDAKQIVTYTFVVKVNKNTNKIFHTALQWEPAAKPGAEFERALDGLLNGCNKAIADLKALKKPVWFADEGVIASKEKDVSRAIWTAWEDILPRLGYCAHWADSQIAVNSQNAVIDYFIAVSKVYKGGLDKDKKSDNDNPGNPVNERHLIPLYYAIDMVYDFMTADEQKIAKSFMAAADKRVVAFVKALNSKDDRLYNNWMNDALVLRSYSALIQRNTSQILAVQKEINAMVKKQFTAPKGWKPSSCANIKKVGSYGSYDFQQRDAFLYHTKAAGLLVQLLALKPTFFDKATKAALLTGLNMTKDYVTGKKKHNEFDCTTVALDKEKRKAKVAGFSGPWVPMNAKVPYRFARIAFPEIKPWTTIYTTDAYAAWVKVFVSGRGDIVDYP